MAAVYPSGIKSFGAVVDAVDVVYAAHINDLRDEVEAVEGELGTGLKTSTWTGAFAQTGSWGNLALRLTNIERGIVTTSDVHTQYVKKAGGAMTGSLTMGGQVIGNLGNGSASTDAVNYGQVLLRSGANAATGNLNMGTSYKITNLGNGSASTDAATKGQVDTVATAAAAAQTTANNALPKAGGTMSGSMIVPTGVTLMIGATGGERSTIEAGGSTSIVITPSNVSGTLLTSSRIYHLSANDTWVCESPLAMGGNKVTGLAAASANGDAVRYEQLTAKLDSARVVSGVWSGTTDAVGDATITLPTSPTGNWAVTLTAKPDSDSDWSMVTVKATTATSVTFRLWRGPAAPQAACSSSSYDVHYIAVAY